MTFDELFEDSGVAVTKTQSKFYTHAVRSRLDRLSRYKLNGRIGLAS